MKSAMAYAVMIGFVCGIGVPESLAQDCPCDADVDGNGLVQIQDWACIQDCKAGNCACCLSSCDVNCDGVVDNADAGADPLNDDSAWLCMFEGSLPETCCPGSAGACCDLDTGTCQDGVFAADCDGANLVWSEGLACTQVSCPEPSVGACCSTTTGACLQSVLSENCAAADQVWLEGQLCADVVCDPPPSGACCNPVTGMCSDGLLPSECTGAGFVWTHGATCAGLGCTVQPQDPCPCDADVDGNGLVQIQDWACIQDCKAGNCACCLSSCDVNCDGVFDNSDAGEDPIGDMSTWNCRFQGGALDYCCSPQFLDHVQAGVPIPTVSQWGVVVLALLLVTSGTLVMHRRRSGNVGVT